MMGLNSNPSMGSLTQYPFKPRVICLVLVGCLGASLSQARTLVLDGASQRLDGVAYQTDGNRRAGLFDSAGESVSLNAQGQIMGQAWNSSYDTMPVIMLGGQKNSLTVNGATLRSIAAGYGYANSANENTLTVNGGVIGTTTLYYPPFPLWIRQSNAFSYRGATECLSLIAGISHEDANNNTLTVTGGLFVSGQEVHQDSGVDYTDSILSNPPTQRAWTTWYGGFGGINANNNTVTVDGTNIRFALDDSLRIVGGKVMLFKDRTSLEQAQASNNTVTIDNLHTDSYEKIIAGQVCVPLHDAAVANNNKLVIGQNSELKDYANISKLLAAWVQGQGSANDNVVTIEGNVSARGRVGSVEIWQSPEGNSEALRNKFVSHGPLRADQLYGVYIHAGRGTIAHNELRIEPREDAIQNFNGVVGFFGGDDVHDNTFIVNTSAAKVRTYVGRLDGILNISPLTTPFRIYKNNIDVQFISGIAYLHGVDVRNPEAPVTIENNDFKLDVAQVHNKFYGIESTAKRAVLSNNRISLTQQSLSQYKKATYDFIAQRAAEDIRITDNTMHLTDNRNSYTSNTLVTFIKSAPISEDQIPTVTVEGNSAILDGKNNWYEKIVFIDNAAEGATVNNNTLTIAEKSDPLINSLIGVNKAFEGDNNALVVKEQTRSMHLKTLDGFDALDLTMNVDALGKDPEHSAIYLRQESLTGPKGMRLQRFEPVGTINVGDRLHLITGDVFDPAKVLSDPKVTTSDSILQTHYVVERYWSNSMLQVGDEAKHLDTEGKHPWSEFNEFNLIVESIEPAEPTDILPQVQAGALGLWNMDDLLVLDDVLAGSHTLVTNNPSDSANAKPFGIVSGGYAGLGSDHAVRVHGRSAAVGITATRPTRSGGTFKLSPFVQGGWSANTTDKGAEQHLDGHSKYAALGVAWRYMGDKWYQDGEVRLGWESENMNAYGFDVPVSTHAGAVASTVVLGVGYMPYQTETRNLDVYGRLQYSHVGERQVSAGDYDITLKRAISERLVLGTRYTQLFADNWQGMLGAGVEQEFKGTFNGDINGMAMTPFSTRGTTGFVETALTRTPRVDKGWHFGLRLRGYAGERDGVLGYLSATYRR